MKNYLIQLIILFSGLIYSQEYIQMTSPSINIRMEPTTLSPIVGHAFNGEIYLINGENPKWYTVLLPSGESRWIYKRLADKVKFQESFPSDVDILLIKEELMIASDEANKDANEEVINGLNKVQINNILFDRYALFVLQKHQTHPIFYQFIIDYIDPNDIFSRQPVAEHLISVSHIDYDLFKIDNENFYIETRRCFKLGSALDAMIFIYYESDNFFQKLCFENGYGKGFENCYNIKNIYSAVLKDPNLVVLTKEGKIKKTNLVLRETILKLPESKY